MIVVPPIHRFKPDPRILRPVNLEWGWVNVDDLVTAAKNVAELANYVWGVTCFYDLTNNYGELPYEVAYYNKECDTLTKSPPLMSSGLSYNLDDTSIQYVPAKWALRVLDLIKMQSFRVVSEAIRFSKERKLYAVLPSGGKKRIRF